jgi:hypothetical protein
MNESKDGPMPGDGVARENEDGTWTVCRVNSHDQLEAVETAPDEATATARLRELFSVATSDQWVVTRFGTARTLN